jgi:hypothetical protein
MWYALRSVEEYLLSQVEKRDDRRLLETLADDVFDVGDVHQLIEGIEILFANLLPQGPRTRRRIVLEAEFR